MRTITRSQITTHSFVNKDYRNGNNSKREERILNLQTEKSIKKLLDEAFRNAAK